MLCYARYMYGHNLSNRVALSKLGDYDNDNQLNKMLRMRIKCIFRYTKVQRKKP